MDPKILEQNFLNYVRDNNFIDAQKLFDQDTEFIPEDKYMNNIIVSGNLPALQYLDDLGVTISAMEEPSYAVESNNIDMVKYIINKEKNEYYGYFNYLAALRLAEKLNYQNIIDYIKTIIEVNPDLVE